MKILLVNKFFYDKGGSEAVFFDSASLLKKMKNEVMYFSMEHPKNFHSRYAGYFISEVDFENTAGFLQKIKAAAKIMYSFESKKKITDLILKKKPDIAHLHNIYHQISPSILHALKKHKIPVVMTLHDYKMLCPVYTMFSRGGTCEKCLHGDYYWCLKRKCNDGSNLRSFLNMVEMYFHRRLLSIYELVDIFISPSKFLIEKMEESGLKGNLKFLPHFIWLEDFEPADASEGGEIAYVGRLSPEKGLFTLLTALKGLDIPCKIVGDGPIRTELQRSAETHAMTNISFLGHKPLKEWMFELKGAKFIVLPSEWYENNPRIILEAFAMGKPVIGSNIGGIPGLIDNAKNGLLFDPGDSRDLRKKILHLWHNPKMVEKMGENARKFIEMNCEPRIYYGRLMKIYEQAIGRY
jgi:glycosyltransferase involved in cell wall biosynthesis